MNAKETINYILSKLKEEGACCLIIDNQVKYVAKVYPDIRQLHFTDGHYLDLSPIESMNHIKTPEELITHI